MTFDICRDILSFEKSGADIVVFTDGGLCVGFEKIVERAVEGGTDAFVLRTAPFEAGYYTDPISGEPFAAYNNAFAAKTSAIESVGGVDKKMGAAAATDIILRMERAGFSVRYIPCARAILNKSPKPAYSQLLFGTLMLRIKFGTMRDIWRGKVLWLKAILHSSSYRIERKTAIIGGLKMFGGAWSLFISRYGVNNKLKNTKTEWNGAELGFALGEYTDIECAKSPLVSLITRTRNRPETLRKTLESLRAQTYDNFETVVVEDGEPLCEGMIKSDFSDLNIIYKATVKNVGRAAAFNLGVSLARGEYLNMLDDDDFLLPEHIELGVAKICFENADMVFLRGIALETERITDEPYEFKVMEKRLLDFPRIEPFTMVRRCLTAEQGVVFKKALCEKVGLMRPELHAHEDWSLWLRMMAHGNYAVLPYAANCCVVPHDRDAERARIEKYSEYDAELLNDDSIVFVTTRAQLDGYYESVINDCAYLDTLGGLDEHLKAEKAQACAFLGKSKIRPASFDALAQCDEIALSGIQLKELYYTLILELEQKNQIGELQKFINSRISNQS
ncbi:MAG: glycosyltransferase family 2 protein [Oscillospiraceae bacterium]